MAGLSRLLMCSAYRRDIEAARARVATGSRVVETPLGRIQYADVGDGLPLLMVHGAGGGFDQGIEVGRRLIDNGFRLIAPSRFGYLGTPLPADVSPEAQADAFACLLDALGLERVAVVGASLGASSTVQLCLRHPHRCSAMVLVVPVLYAPRGPGKFLQRSLALVRRTPDIALRSDFLFWLAARAGGAALIEALIGVPRDELRNADEQERNRIRAMLDLALPMSARAAGLRNDVCTDLSSCKLETIEIPTLIIGVETDLYGTSDIARYTAGQIRGSELLTFADGGHLWVGHHEDMLAAIGEFAVASSVAASA